MFDFWLSALVGDESLSSSQVKKIAAKIMAEQISNLFSAEGKKLGNTELLSLKTPPYSPNPPPFENSDFTAEIISYHGALLHTHLVCWYKTCFWSLDSQSFKISHFDWNWKCNFSMPSCHSFEEMSPAGLPMRSYGRYFTKQLRALLSDRERLWHAEIKQGNLLIHLFFLLYGMKLFISIFQKPWSILLL